MRPGPRDPSVRMELNRGMTAKGLPTRNLIVAAAAGFAVAQRHHGLADPAGEDLYPVVVPPGLALARAHHAAPSTAAHSSPRPARAASLSPVRVARRLFVLDRNTPSFTSDSSGNIST